MKLENMLVVFLVEGSFPCRLGLYNLDMASVGGNQGAILLPEGWNSDRLGDRKCRMTMEIELVKSFHFGTSRSRGRGSDEDGDDVGGWNGECHGRLFILGDNRDIVGHGWTGGVV